jgi:glucose/arabinose dehydrogenase
VDRRMVMSRLFFAASATAVTGCLDGGGASETSYTVEKGAKGFEQPWGIAFLDGTRAVVTELPGRLRIIDTEDGTARVVDGTPEVASEGQGGLLDVTPHPDYTDGGWVYLTYSAEGDGGTATHVGRGRLETDAPRLRDFEVLHVAEPFVDSSIHYGSRALFGDDGALYVTSGDRGFKNFGSGHVAQDVTNELGCILRLNPDGSAHDDNPFVDDPVARNTVYSYGHRNPQGLTFGRDGELWESEHGERDGDEINVIEAGENYGWPIASESCEYGTDTPVSVPHEERDGVTPPVHFWECGSGGFPPAGMTFYTGDAFPGWQGDLFVGNLAGAYLGRLGVDGYELTRKPPLLGGRGWRIRDVTEGADGYLYALVDGSDAPVVRLVPED